MHEEPTNTNIQTTEAEIKDESSIYQDDEELDFELVGKIYDKKQLLNTKRKFKIINVGRNKWNKPILTVTQENDTNEYILNISKSVFNELINKFGKKAGQWKNKEIEFIGKPFAAEIDGKIKTGVEMALTGNSNTATI